MYISPQEAALLIKQNGIVAIPTETVYGLAGNAFSEVAVAKIFAAKERPFFDPLIAHISDMDMLQMLASEIPEQAKVLAKAFFPGALTLVLPKQKSVPDLTTGGLSTVAVRMPKHKIAQEIINLSGTPLAAPSANLFKHLSPTSAKHVSEQLGNRIDGIVDGGQCEIGVESTVVGFEKDSTIIYRPGAVTKEMLEEALGKKVLELKNQNSEDSNLPSPGLLKKHYSPNTPLLLSLPQTVPQNSGLLAFGKLPENHSDYKEMRNLSANSDIIEAATNLYKMLHELDSMNLSCIYACKLPEKYLGAAINDRLTRAAG